MNTTKTTIDGLLVIEPKIFGDARGYFLETWNKSRYESIGICETFLQDNVSLSSRGILRGLHYQHPHAQGKLVSVMYGTVLDVVVDLRKHSPSFGQHFSIELDGESKRQLYIPSGFAHGFAVLSQTALFHYKCTELYRPDEEMTLQWNDPQLGIDWRTDSPTLSAKDQAGIPLKKIPEEKLFD